MTKIVRRDLPLDAERPRAEEKKPAVGEWYWVDWTSNYDSKKKGRGLACATEIGSNYVEFTFPSGSVERVHIDEFPKCELETSPRTYLDGKVKEYQGIVNALMGEVHDVVRRLSVTPVGQIDQASSETQALVTSAHAQDPKKYKQALVRAKEKQLPDLFGRIKKANEKLAMWMTAETIPLKAQAEQLKENIEAIEHRIFNVELYAGLVEEVVQIRKGEAAGEDEPVHLMQRRLYMDEECLAHYETGGMEYDNIREFDRWIARDDNFERTLPHERCIVALQVRREVKERGDINLWIKIQLENEDKLTFLYMRNGEQLYRLSTEIEFAEKLFPDLDNQQLNSGELWAERGYSNKWTIISENEYRGRVEDAERASEECEARVAELKAQQETIKLQIRDLWKTKKKKEREEEEEKLKQKIASLDHEVWLHQNRVRNANEEWKDFIRFEPDTVYFDDIRKSIGKQIAEHNRLVLVVQGLLDRSPVFHPHPRWRIWEGPDFESAVRLVYDSARVLAPAELPDFEAYRARVNASLAAGCFTVGQRDFWRRAEAEKYNASYRGPSRNYYPEFYEPYGNPGPKRVAEVAAYAPRAKKCTYRWERERQDFRKWWKRNDGPIKCAIEVPASELLNVSAYRPGDFRQFYADPRTRAEYLKWAPLLLAAEEWHAEQAKTDGANTAKSKKEKSK